MFWDIYFELCKRNGTTPTATVKALGFSAGSVTSWKNGKVPHHGTLIKIADYFGVSVDYLLGKEEAGESEEMKKIHELIGQLTEEEVQEAINYILFKRAQKNNRP